MAAAALTRFFPDLEVSSAGIEAVEGQRIPQSILNLADAWGLGVPDVVSHSLQAIEQRLIESDFVVVAEDAFIPRILEIGVSPNKILSMQDPRFDHAVIPFDPIGQGDRVLSVELAKSIMTTMQLLRLQTGFGHKFPVKAVITKNEEDLQSKLSLVWETARVTNGVAVLADFRAPNFRSVSQVCDNLVELKIDRADQKISFKVDGEDWDLGQVLAMTGPVALSGRFELNQVEKFLLGPHFRQLLASLTSVRPVTILTEPEGQGPCPFLAASNANFGPILS